MSLAYEGPHLAAPVGSTGNATHKPVHVGADYSSVGMQVVVEAVGATPTVTYKWQGSPDHNPATSVAATLSTAMAGADNDITLDAVEPGAWGNSITITLTDPATDTADASVVVTGRAINVTLGYSTAAIDSTATEVVAAINASGAASALVTASVKSGDDGSGVVTALSATNLASGSDSGNWYDAAFITDASDTLSVATTAVTAVGGSLHFTCNPAARRYKAYRLVTTVNTNVTYRGEVYLID